MAGSERLVLIDGTAVAYRSFFALFRNPLINSRGMNTSAAFGFANVLLKLLDEDPPERLVVVFDTPEPTFRHERYADYKATREKMPEEMGWQLPYIDKLVDALGLCRLAKPGFEADDVIGTLARRGAEAGLDVVVLTADKDLMQLVGERVRILNPWSGDPSSLIGAKEVEQKMGVPPGLVRDLLALMGDSSDNIPGVPGVGAKTALALLEQFGSMQAALDGTDQVKRKKLKENLVTFRDQALLSYDLVTIDLDVPIEADLESLRVADPDRPALVELFGELEFNRLLKRFSGSAETEAQSYVIVEPDDEAEIGALVERLQSAEEVVFDLETAAWPPLPPQAAIDPLRADVVGIGFAVSPGEAFYVPAYPEPPEGEVDPGLAPQFSDRFAPAMERLRPLLEDAAVAKGGQNIKYDVLVLGRYGVRVAGLTFDTLIESHLLDPSIRSHRLDDLALRFLGYKKIATLEVLGKGKKQKRMDEVPVADVGRYCCEDADITLRLHHEFAPRLAEHRGLQRVYREVEIPLLTVLVEMEQAGVQVDTAVLKGLSEEFEGRRAALAQEVFDLAGGEEFNLASPKQLGEVLFDKLEIQAGSKKRPRKTKTGAWSTDEATLESYSDHPIVSQVLEHRSLTKLKSTYVDALPAMVNPASGRIHTSFNQAGAATGRLASSNPNLQNIPIRTPEGRRIRAAFVSGSTNRILMSADYSQIELRLLAHFTADSKLLEAFRAGLDIHRATAARVFGLEPEAVDADMRGRAKAVNFGVLYGMGASRLARETGMTQKEAQGFIEDYFDKFPSIKQWIEGQVEKARTDGWVETILGRRRLLPDIHGSNPMVRANAERIAVNTPLQGSAADLIKVAMNAIQPMLRSQDLGARMLLQVHDELLFELEEASRDALKDLVQREMEGAVELSVPLRVEVGCGATWLEAH